MTRDQRLSESRRYWKEDLSRPCPPRMCDILMLFEHLLYLSLRALQIKSVYFLSFVQLVFNEEQPTAAGHLKEQPHLFVTTGSQ